MISFGGIHVLKYLDVMSGLVGFPYRTIGASSTENSTSV